MKKTAKYVLVLLTMILCASLWAVTANAATTSRTTTRTSTRRIAMSSKARTSKTTAKTTTRKNTKNSQKNNVKTTTVTTVRTTVQNSIKRNSRIKTVRTTVKTNAKTTTTKVAAKKASSTAAKAASSSSQNTSKSLSINSLAPKASASVRSAFTKLGFTVKVNSSVNYTGYFNAVDQSITLKKQGNDSIYHELGHFVAFVSGNTDKKAEFQAIYKAEKSKYKEADKAYVTSSASEYFAESYRNYIENAKALKASRPQTYAYIVKALSNITNSQVSKIAAAYAPIWK